MYLRNISRRIMSLCRSRQQLGTESLESMITPSPTEVRRYVLSFQAHSWLSISRPFDRHCYIGMDPKYYWS